MKEDTYWDLAQAASEMRGMAERLRAEADVLDSQANQLEMNAGQYGKDLERRIKALEDAR